MQGKSPYFSLRLFSTCQAVCVCVCVKVTGKPVVVSSLLLPRGPKDWTQVVGPPSSWDSFLAPFALSSAGNSAMGLRRVNDTVNTETKKSLSAHLRLLSPLFTSRLGRRVLPSCPPGTIHLLHVSETQMPQWSFSNLDMIVLAGLQDNSGVAGKHWESRKWTSQQDQSFRSTLTKHTHKGVCASEGCGRTSISFMDRMG